MCVWGGGILCVCEQILCVRVCACMRVCVCVTSNFPYQLRNKTVISRHKKWLLSLPVVAGVDRTLKPHY